MSVFFKSTHTLWQTAMILDTRVNFFLICVFSNEGQRVLYVTFIIINKNMCALLKRLEGG